MKKSVQICVYLWCKFLLVFVILTYLSETSFAQLHDDLVNKTSKTFSTAGASGSFSVASDAIHNRFSKTYYNSGYIDNTMKDEVSSSMNNSSGNRLGGDANAGIYFEHFGDSLFGRPGGYWFAVNDKNRMDGLIKRDMFDLFFRGNKMFEGKTADLSGFRLNAISYRTIETGFIEKIKCRNGVSYYGVGVALVQGVNYFHAETFSNSSLFTATDGESLNPSLNLQILQSDTSPSKFSDFKGTGAAASMFFIHSEKNKYTFKVEVSDLGKIVWNSKSITTTIDTSFYFQGIEMKNIFKPDSTEFAEYDSTFINKFYKSAKGSYETILPATFHFSYQKIIIPEKLNITAGIRNRLMADFTSQVYATLCYRACKDFEVSTIAMYGGYGKFSGGMQVLFEPIKGLSIISGSEYLTSYFRPDGKGMGAYVMLKKVF